jgi:hypothetical protein
MRSLIYVVWFCAVAAGCKTTAIDPCAKIVGTCINLTVTSQQVHAIDTLIIAAGDPIANSTASTLGRTGELPVHVAITLPSSVSGSVHFDLTGLLNQAAQGIGSFDSVITPGQHVPASAEIEPDSSVGGDGGIDMSDTNTDMPLMAAGAARLITPLSTSTVTNHRPHVRWQLPAGATNPQLDFCATRTCAQIIGATTIASDGLSGSPTADLPVGTIFWRVRTSGPTGEVISATWELVVQKKVKPLESVDSSGGTFLDVNGDGRGDVAVGAPLAPVKGVTGVGRVYVFHSTATGFDSTPAVLDGPGGAGSNFAQQVFSAGDVNGDGYADLAVVNSGKDTFIYHGGPSGIANGATPSEMIAAAVANESIAAAGDLNADGYADLVVGAPQSGMPGQAYVLFGGPNGISKTPASIVDGSDAMMGVSSPQFGTSVSGAGDVNGDGYDDVIIGAPDQTHMGTTNTGNAYVYLGGPTKLAPFPQPSLTDVTLPSFGLIVKGGNDLDADGYADLIIGTNSQTVVVVLGGPASFRAGPTLTDPQSGSGFASDAREIAAVGDINGDGLGDVVIGAPSAFPTTGGTPGAIHVFVGTMTGGVFGLNDLGAKYGPDGDNSAFAIVAGAGDVDGDGRADVLVGATCAPTTGGACGDGTAYLFKGTVSGLPATADQKWVGPDQHGLFGIVATLLRRRFLPSLVRPS